MRLYFGSVRFFKHLILTVTALLIIVPTVLCIIFAVDNAKKSEEIDRLNSRLSAQSEDIYRLRRQKVPMTLKAIALRRIQIKRNLL